MRLEVYDVVVKWWRIYGHPFVSVKYLRTKEEALEVF
jgi:sulfate adenylyltransferase